MNSIHKSQQLNGSSMLGGSGMMSRNIASTTNEMNNSNGSNTNGNAAKASSNHHQTTNNTANSSSSSIDHLMNRLVTKICAQNSPSNVGENKKQEFISQKVAFLSKLFRTDSFTTNADSFELTEKFKKKLISQKREDEAKNFIELESRFSKIKIVKNRASLLQFFYIYFSELFKYDASAKSSSMSSYSTESRLLETPSLTDHVTDDLINKSELSKKFTQLFKDESANDTVTQKLPRMKHSLILEENYILRELIYALQGIDGKLFQKDTRDPCSLVIKVEMERSVKLYVLRFLELGWLYLRLRKFLSTYNNNPSAGLILQAYCAYVSTELKEYHRLLAVLEAQLGDKEEGAESSSNLTLRRLLVWLDQPLERLKFLNIVCDAIKDKKGGILLSTLHAYSINGDVNKSSLLKSALGKCAVPIRDMIIEWIYDGQIRDQHEEFFVSFDNSVLNERLWHDKYKLRVGQIPSFINEEQANKILVVGKSINFMRTICNEKQRMRPLVQIPSIEGMLDQKKDLNFQEMIDVAYIDTSSSLIEILMNKYKLMDHFNALRRYLLLGQGDFIRHLMDLMEPELNKSAQKINLHNLQRLLEKAISETNAQFDPAYIIQCLDVRVLPESPNEVGWDVFTLDYNIEGPLRTIFTQECLRRYLRIFNFLWRVKRMEYTTCATWRSHKADMEKFRTMPEFYEAVHQSNIISSEMLRLVQNLNFYIMFEVLEVSWKVLCEKLENARDMDDVIDANEKFLDTIISQLLLDQQSTEIASELRTIFDLIVKMSNLKEDCFKLANDEFETRNDFRQRIKDCGDDLENEDEVEMLERAEKKRFFTEVKPKIKQSKHQIGLLKQSFNDMVKKLLDMLNVHQNESLRFLSFRFNFNEYYTPPISGFSTI